MRILIISRYPPFPGGRENFVFELVKQLSKDDVVLVVTPDQEDSECGNLIIRKYPRSKRELETIIATFGPDVVNSHTFYLSQDAAEISKVLKVPFGITLHGDQFAIGDMHKQEIVSDVVRMSDFVINVSENGKESIIKNVPGINLAKLSVINNGVNLQTFNSFLKTNNVKHREEFGISLEKTVIVVPTRIAVYKGLTFLLSSIIESRSFLETKDILFLVSVPDYPFSEQETLLFDKLKQKIKQSNIGNLIQFISLGYQEMPKAYSVADLFLLSSEKEQLPMSILEAMACNIPVIATRVGGIVELLEDGRDGYLVEFGDTQGLIRNVEKCLQAENAREMSGAAYKKVQEIFSIEAAADLYKSLYQQCKK